jgi:hypothetical protein
MRYILAFVVGACVSGTAASARAQSGIPTRELPGITSTVAGTVVSSTTTELVLDDDRGVRRPFVVDGSSGLPAGLVAGMRVSVTFDLVEGRAHLVHVGTSDTMDADRPEGPPMTSNGAFDATATPPSVTPAAVDGATGRDGSPARTDAEAARREERHENASPWPPILVTAALGLGASVVVLRACHIL